MDHDSAGGIHEAREKNSRDIRLLKTAMFWPDFVAIASFFLVLNVAVGILFSKQSVFSPSYIIGLIGLAAFYAYLLARFQYSVARKGGADFILKKYSAKPLDLKIGSHGQYHELVEEMKDVAGLAKVNIYIIPFRSINALALVEPDGTPCLALTDGLLAGFTRDEIEAVVAREMALINRGDVHFKTLVCSLADFLERFRHAFDYKDPEEGTWLYSLSSRMRRFMSRHVNPAWEIQADAAAVGLGRHPVVLAQILAKAFSMNLTTGDLDQAYGPLFFVPPELEDKAQDSAGWMTSAYSPLITRIRRLAIAAGQKTEDIIPKDVLQILMKKPKAPPPDQLEKS